MVLVDTTVWIDFFANKKTPQVSKFIELIEKNEDICVCGVVLTEILQGFRNDKDFDKTLSVLNDLIYLPDSKESFILASRLYRGCKKKGFTIRKPIDCIIAAICIENSVFILHNDRDFNYISAHFPLQSI
jgi:Predicted nucleic acid-binding protein, contains PIN domain